MENTSNIRNESFINTASKLLEKAKQNQLNQSDETRKQSTNFIRIKQQDLLQQNIKTFKTNEELIQN